MQAEINNIFYVYAYLDPRKPGQYKYGEFEFDHEPIYIGKGKENRFKYHLFEFNLKSNTNKMFINKVKKIISNNSNPIVFKLFENLTEDKSFQKEIELIKLIGRKDLKLGSLCNLTDGGEGASGFVMSNETKDKIRQGNLGKIISEETRIKTSKANSGRKHTKETIEKNRKARLGKKHSAETKQKMSNSISKRTDEYRNKIRSVTTGSKNPFYGKKHSEETKEKIRLSKLGKKLSEEHKNKISESLKINYSERLIS